MREILRDAFFDFHVAIESTGEMPANKIFDPFVQYPKWQRHAGITSSNETLPMRDIGCGKPVDDICNPSFSEEVLAHVQTSESIWECEIFQIIVSQSRILKLENPKFRKSANLL